ncbi:MAG TPA: MFS transporter [Planctomycetota bacterium]|nr:MFS transporter [Planctomycetota bacterium]HRU51845.1 MFS transporter [Planctomycetota bacterium]
MLNKLKIASWCLFDFGTTAFMMNIVSLSFVQWLSQAHGKENADASYGIISAVCYVLCLVIYPFSGEMCDRGWKITPLFVLTFISVLSTALLGVSDQLWVAGLFFILAYFTYQIGLTYYTALLDDIATPENYGIVSGLGVATRYTGAIVGLLSVGFFINGSQQSMLPSWLQFLIVEPVEQGKTAYVNAFMPTAILYGLCTLPLFCLVRTKSKVEHISKSMSAIVNTIIKGFADIWKNKNAFWLLVTVFLVGLPVYATVHFMTIFLKEIGQMPDEQMAGFIAVATIFAVAGGLAFGISLRKLGNKLAFYIIAVLWTFIMFAGCIVSGPFYMSILGILAGVGMGSYWAVSRIIVFDIAPEGKKGEYVALLFMIMVVCGIASSLIWPLAVEVTTALQNANILPDFIVQRSSMFILALLTFAGLLTYRKVKFDM